MINKNIISTKDLDEVARIHSEKKYIDWKMEYVDGEYKFYSPTYQQENTYVTLEQLEPLLSESGYMCLGHGTGRSGDSDDVVESIFTEGLRTKDNSLYYTTVGLSTPTEEIKKQYKEWGLNEPSIDGLKQQFNNWQHLDSKKIIIVRLPIEYINQTGDHADGDGEMYGAFYTQKIQPNGKATNYLDSKFIVGCYDVETQLVKLNKNYEQTLTPTTIKKLKEGYQQALAKTKKRIENIVFPSGKRQLETSVQSDQPIPIYEFSTGDDDFDEFFDDEDWKDIDTNTKSK